MDADDGFARCETGDIPQGRQRRRYRHFICKNMAGGVRFREICFAELKRTPGKLPDFCCGSGGIFRSCCVEYGGNLIEEKRE